MSPAPDRPAKQRKLGRDGTSAAPGPPPRARAASGLRRGRSDYHRTLRRGPSLVHEAGLFSAVPLRRGDFVCDYYGVAVPRASNARAGGGTPPPTTSTACRSGGDGSCAQEDSDRKQCTSDTKIDVIFGLNDWYQIDPRCEAAATFDSGSLARYINHSCEPNLCAVRLHLRHDLGLADEEVRAMRLPTRADSGGCCCDGGASSSPCTRGVPAGVSHLRHSAEAACDAARWEAAHQLLTRALHELSSAQLGTHGVTPPATSAQAYAENLPAEGPEDGGCWRRCRASVLSARASVSLEMLRDPAQPTVSPPCLLPEPGHGCPGTVPVPMPLPPLSAAAPPLSSPSPSPSPLHAALSDASACVVADPGCIWGYMQRARALRLLGKETEAKVTTTTPPVLFGGDVHVIHGCDLCAC
jgi:hypothetical protein